MTGRQSTAKKSVFSASAVLDAIATELSTIKHEDNLTFADLGRVLGKSEDQAAKYCVGHAEMGIVAFAAMKREYNGRFTGALDRLCVDSRPVASGHDQADQCAILKAALALSLALQDGAVDASEVRANRRVLEEARAAIDAQLAKLVRVVA